MARSQEVSGSDAKKAVSNKFPVFPPGEYIGEIIDVKQKKSTSANNKGFPMLDIQFRFLESGTGEGEGKKYTAFSVPDKAKWSSGSVAFLFYQLYKALGVVFPEGDGVVDLPDIDELFGQEVGIRLKVEEKVVGGEVQTDDEGNPVLQNTVSAFFPASKGVKTSATAGVDKDEFTL